MGVSVLSFSAVGKQEPFYVTVVFVFFVTVFPVSVLADLVDNLIDVTSLVGWSCFISIVSWLVLGEDISIYLIIRRAVLVILLCVLSYFSFSGEPDF